MPTIDSTLWTRRGVILALGAAGILALAGWPSGAAAAATDDATAAVTQLAADLTRIVNSGKGETALYADFERMLVKYADMPAVAASVLGPPWRSASPAQKQAFVAAFQAYLARKYGRQFRDWQDATISVTGAKDGGKAGILVASRVRRPGQEDVGVDWQISARSGSPKVVNLIIEGVSMLANERAEIAAILETQKGSVDGLIGALKAQA